MHRIAALVVTAGLLAAVAPPAQAVDKKVVVVKGTPRLRIIGTEAVEVAPGRGRLVVNVDPNVAFVIVDGRNLGRGDKNLVLRPGVHTVRVRVAGRQAMEKVRVEPGQVTRVRLDLD
jgi:hypothetical protein